MFSIRIVGKVLILSEAEAKALVVGINFNDVTLKSVVRADKGQDDDKDFFLGFYFDSIEEAEKFNSKNNNENLGLMAAYGEATLGKDLKPKQGSHNNVAYVGSETSFDKLIKLKSRHLNVPFFFACFCLQC